MRFMMMTTETDQNPDESLYVEMAKFIDEMTKAGVLVATGGLDPKVTQIRSSGGKITVTDGPYSEAKEAVVGFALVEVESREQAIEVSKRFWAIVGDGAGVIQQVFS
jgi:hypothetical protein